MLNFVRRSFSDQSQRVFRPTFALNFKTTKSVLIFNGSHCKNTNTVSRIKFVHMMCIAFATYSLIQAYRKRRYFRGFLVWTPLLVMLVALTGSTVFKYRFATKLYLRGDGAHVDIYTRPFWQSKLNVPIVDLQPIDRDELVTLLSDNNMLLA